MPKVELRANVITYNATVSACEKGGQWQPALNLLRLLPMVKLAADRITYSAAISACEKSRQWQQALLLLSFMPEASVVANRVTYSAAVSACEKSGQWQHALNLLTLMDRSTVAADAITYNAAISACEKGRQWQLAIHLLILMRQAKLTAGEITYNAAISACEKGGQWQLALHLLDSMPSNKVEPGIASYSAVVHALEQVSTWPYVLAMLSDTIPFNLANGIHVGSAANALRKSHGSRAALNLLSSWRKKWHKADREARNSTVTSNEALLRLVGDDLLILHQGPGIAVMLKPAGVATETMVGQLSEHLHREGAAGNAHGVCIVSRLDFSTSGVLPVALGGEGSAAANWLLSQFSGRAVDKRYVCLCEGLPIGADGCTGLITSPLHTFDLDGQSSRSAVSSSLGREASTKYEIVARYVAKHSGPSSGTLKFMLIKLFTGRTHQIRVHMASVGQPLVGDSVYGLGAASLVKKSRLFLHCLRISLQDLAGNPVTAQAALPTKLLETMAQLKSL
eukprot:TRINITY_DN24748_c3_g1_i1.p1 TRINITY_DN24748_c3_g1~~TRINITY_DN24748_c3_g1_i1.p1  ORF type:complete len:552 (+),score=71.55 TRINITY_DN24748_c3_g1_i1:132-1658(+)